MQIGAATMENRMEVTQELKRELVYDPAIPLLSIYPKNTETLIQKYLGTYIYTSTHTHTHTHTHNGLYCSAMKRMKSHYLKPCERNTRKHVHGPRKHHD